MYPYKYSLSFAEHFYFPSLIVFVISFFTSNILAQFNVFMVLNHILIFLSFFLLLGELVKNYWAKLFASFYISFSPYIYSQLGHAQMVIIWPLFISLYFLFKNERLPDFKYIVFCGVFLGFQFLSAVYLGIMGLTCVGTYILTQILWSKQDLWKSLKNGVIIMIFFTAISLVSVIGYGILTKNYDTTRDPREYIIYAAHLTDYIFPASNQFSKIYTSSIVHNWTKFNFHHMGEKAAFIGFIPTLLLLSYLFRLKKSEKNWKLSLKVNKTGLYLFLLIIIGFTFSLGPRLNVNGQYLHIPLPYYGILKLPLLNVMRAEARWFLLVIIASGFIIGLGLDNVFQHIKQKYPVILSSIFVFFLGCLFILEFYTPPLSAYKVNWWTKDYDFATKICQKAPGPMLEYPLTYRNENGDMIKDLQYKTRTLMASTMHNCPVLSGYPGFEPPEYFKNKIELDNGFDKKDIELITTAGFKYVKMNKYALYMNEYKDIEPLLKKSMRLIYRDKKVDIYTKL